MPSSTAKVTTEAFSPFIISTSLDKPDARTRKLIRSHVMRGKNAGKVRSKPVPATETRGSHNSGRSEGACQKRPKSRVQSEGFRFKDSEEWVLVPPRKVVSDISLLGFMTDHSELKPYMLELIYRAFTVVKPSTYTLHHLTEESPENNLFCFSNLLQYPGVLHSTLFAAQIFHDLSIGQPYGNVARLHLGKAIQHLQRSLDDREEAMSYSTMAVVTSLAVAAIVAGDPETAGKHMDGLRKILDLRGGVKSLVPGSLIDYKAKVLDFGLAIGLNQPLRFSLQPDDEIGWSPEIAQSRYDKTGKTGSRIKFPELLDALILHPPRPDPRLLNVWADLREFSRMGNDAAASGTKMPMKVATRLASSAPDRLLRLAMPPGSERSLHELLRYCMLAYVKVLLIKLKGIGRKMTFLAERLRVVLRGWWGCLKSQTQAGSQEEGVIKLVFWGLIVASVSIFEECDEEEWLCEMLAKAAAALGLRSWADAKDVLKGFLWIDLIFDELAEHVFERWCSEGCEM